MVTGRNAQSSRSYSRYYHCGTYARNGSKACKRNSVPKDKIENALINCLIKEFSLLLFPGSLEDEVRRFVSYQNRDVTFQVARIDDDLKHLTKRINIAKQEKCLPDNSMYIAQYVAELQKEVEKLTSERAEVSKLIAAPDFSVEQLQVIRDRVKDFAARIKIEPPDVQFSLLKQYVDSIVLDQFTKSYKVKIHLNSPLELSNVPVKILERTVYFSLDLQ